ncbi:LOW QUALITY PROTEIN: heat stress transcription factor B-2b-like [Oryza glaberrima]|nr:LOW QUALITY PROTEIN: heat stress transcription factor B-2b-like [Oryza glaberrima]
MSSPSLFLLPQFLPLPPFSLFLLSLLSGASASRRAPSPPWQSPQATPVTPQRPPTAATPSSASRTPSSCAVWLRRHSRRAPGCLLRSILITNPQRRARGSCGVLVTNDCFWRGEWRLLCEIHRQKVTPPAPATTTTTTMGEVTVAAAIPMALPVTTRDCSPVLSGEEQVISSSSSPKPPLMLPQAPSSSGSGGVESGDMGDENEQLRREDVQLARELSQMRKLCNNILPLMSKYFDIELLRGAPSSGR